MKELLKELAAYNIWATKLLTDTIVSLPAEKQTATVVSSFDSLYKTLLHMLNAESIWWQRMKLLERIQVPQNDFKGDTQELATTLLNQSRQWEEWVRNASDHSLDHVFQYTNTKREQFKQPIFQMLLHVFNHSTYHRGQLVTILRQLGVEKIPSTDFINWSRYKNK